MRTIQILSVAILAIFLVACKTTTTAELYGGSSDEQIFNHAESQIAKGNYETAVKDLEALDTLYPFGRYSEQGQLNIIYAYYKSGDNESALAAADRYIRLYPRSPSIDYAYYMKGLANMGRPHGWVDKWTRADPAQLDSANLQEAYKDFALLVKRYPNSQYTDDARQRMARIVGIMAQHELEVAEFYMVRKAYVASANRANTVATEYPGMPQVPAALAIMIEAYTALNEPQMANAARQRLLSGFPDSAEARKYAL
jgi:outer membrane protein assembly factor BamD